MNSNKTKISQTNRKYPENTDLQPLTTMATASSVMMPSSAKILLNNKTNGFQYPHGQTSSNFFGDIPNRTLFPGSGLDINSNTLPADCVDYVENFTSDSASQQLPSEPHLSKTAAVSEPPAPTNSVSEKSISGTKLQSVKPAPDNNLPSKNSSLETKLSPKPLVSKTAPNLEPPVSITKSASGGDPHITPLKQRSASFDSVLETPTPLLNIGVPFPTTKVPQLSLPSQHKDSCKPPQTNAMSPVKDKLPGGRVSDHASNTLNSNNLNPDGCPIQKQQEDSGTGSLEETDHLGKLRTFRSHFSRSRRFSADDDIWMRNVAAYTHSYLTIPDPNNQKLNWTKPPLTVLIIRKHLDETVLIPFRDLVVWLVKEKNMVLYVEQAVMEEQILSEDEGFQSVQEKLKAFKEDDDLTDKIDFIICLGGDGTLLYASTLFQSSVPPVMAFNMGSLGFLTPFQFYQDFKQEVSRVMQGSASLLLRYRLKCVVVRHDKDTEADIPHVKNIHKEHRSLKTHKLVLNEVVVDRGSSSYLSNLDLYIEGRRVTSVQGDGLIISTPTGSTAYAVAAGASMIHPSVPCILLTPICPHSLSFRPVVVPAGVEIKIVLSPGARGTAMVSFDGRDRIEIHQGDSLRITTASYPVPSVCAADQIEDWFDGLAVCLNWNLRQQQRPLQSTNSLTSIDSFDLIQ